jgi:predicted transcriptional regulator
MSAIRDEEPESDAHLAELTRRAPPNVKRTLDKLAAVGLVTFRTQGRKKVPRMAAKKITIEMDPFSTDDKIVVTPVAKVVPSRGATH